MIHSTTTIDILRHGECEGGNIYRGSTDVALHDNGWSQMRQASEQVSGDWKRVYTSPLQRCSKFTQLLAEEQGLKWHIEDGLRETYFGEWEGQEVEHVWTNDFDRVKAWLDNPREHHPPGGETTEAFLSRVTTAFSDLVDRHRGEHFGVVTHGGVIRVLIAHIMQTPFNGFSRMEVPYACLSRIQVVQSDFGEAPRLIFHNPGHL